MFKNFWHNKLILLLLFALGLVLRIIALSLAPHGVDMATFGSWGSGVYLNGLFHTYSNMWSDYLPLPMLLFGLIKALASLISLDFSLVFRIFWLLIESSLIVLIALSSTNKLKSFFTLWLLLPLIANTSWWGQIDSTPALLSLLSLLWIQNSHKLPAAVLLALAVAIKPIMLVTVPVFMVIGWKKRALPHFLFVGILVLGLSGIPAVTTTIQELRPFSLISGFSYVFTQSLYQTGMYPATTVNAFNIWSIQGTFWSRDDLPVLGVTAQQLGYLIFTLYSGVIMYSWFKVNFAPSRALLVAGQLMLGFYTFTTRMHERHLLFALPFLALSIHNIRTTLVSLGLSLLYLLNLWGALFWLNHNSTWPYSQPLLIIFSWGVVLLTLLSLALSFPSFLSRLKHTLLSAKILVLLLGFALSLRLFNLGTPPNMIFDEVYHSFTAKEYLIGNTQAWTWWAIPPEGFAYEWTHPPVAKYGMVLGMLLSPSETFGYRFGSALMGTLSILGIYLLVLRVSKSRSSALLAVFLLSIEGLHLVQSRIGMNDTYMLAFLVWSLVLAQRGRWKFSAILFGLALASKWSALYGLIPLAYLYLMEVRLASLKQLLYRIFLALRLVTAAVVVYLLTFTPFLLSGRSPDDLIELHRQMWSYHTGLVATHDYQSTPLEWMFILRPVWYYVKYGDGVTSNIYALGNPLILTTALLSSLYLIWKRCWRALPLLISALIFTLPWVFSPRIMFFYHYLPTATFLTATLAVTLSKLPRLATTIFLSLAALVFVVLSPFYYGYPVPQLYWESIFSLFPTWR